MHMIKGAQLRGGVNFYDYQQMYENVRKSLEQCDVDADIELFVTTKSTGSDRPGEELCILSRVVCHILYI